MSVVHDGVDGVVVDAATQKPLAGAFVFDRLEARRPHVLASSGADGRVHLEAARRLTLAAPLGEALIFQSLWICKEGYAPVEVGGRSGWNADYGPSKVFEVGKVELARSALDPENSCADIKGPGLAG